jgi:2-methylcitrate dehydratase PrpD
MDKVEYAVDTDSTFPRHYSGEVQVTLDDGRTLSSRVAVNRGNPERPLSNAEIEAKYFENCAMTLSEPAARRIRNLVLDLDSLKSAVQFEGALALSGELPA